MYKKSHLLICFRSMEKIRSHIDIEENWQKQRWQTRNTFLENKTKFQQKGFKLLKDVEEWECRKRGVLFCVHWANKLWQLHIYKFHYDYLYTNRKFTFTELKCMNELQIKLAVSFRCYKSTIPREKSVSKLSAKIFFPLILSIYFIFIPYNIFKLNKFTKFVS